MLIYCVRCKKKVQGKNPVGKMTKNSRPYVLAHCPKCKGKISRMMSNHQATGSGLFDNIGKVVGIASQFI
jgi:RNase P subunit RPR2